MKNLIYSTICLFVLSLTIIGCTTGHHHKTPCPCKCECSKTCKCVKGCCDDPTCCKNQPCHDCCK